MAENKNKEFIRKLKNTREYLNVLEYRFISKEKKLRKEIELITGAKANINDMLYELTGNEFYRNSRRDGKEKQEKQEKQDGKDPS